MYAVDDFNFWFYQNAEKFDSPDMELSKKHIEENKSKDGQCYFNSFIVASRNDTAQYYEGVTNTGLPHAWAVIDEKVIESSPYMLENPIKYYFGIPIPIEFLKKRFFSTERCDETLIPFFQYCENKAGKH